MILRVVKILNTFILPRIQKLKEVPSLLVEAINYSELFNSYNISHLREINEDIYLKFIINIFKLHKKHNVFNIFIESLSEKFIIENLEMNLVLYLQRNKIKEIIIYGAGEIFNNLYPYLKNKKIKIIGICDKSLKQKIFNNIRVLSKIELVTYSYPIVIASVSFANEIKKELLEIVPSNIIINVHDIY